MRAIRSVLASDYPLRPADPESPLQAFADRLPDPAALHHLLAALGPDGSGDPFPLLRAIDALDPTSATTARTAVRQWHAWTAPQLTSNADGTQPAPAAWDRRHLEYAFTLTAAAPDGPTSLVAGGDVTLHASGYDGSGLDWYSFDRDRASGGRPGEAEPTVTVRPAKVKLPGHAAGPVLGA